MTIVEAAAVAKAQAEVCTPRGRHRPEMTKRVVIDGAPFRFRLCADCQTWVDPEPIFSQDGVRA